jgi:hypothetical protein
VGGLGLGKVEAGDLEAVEQETSASGIDVVGGDAAEDLPDGVLDGGAILWQRHVEGGAAAAPLARTGDWLAGVVVVVAELFSAEAWARAAVSVGEDVAALVLFRCLDSLLHVFPPHGCFFVQSLRKKRDRSGLRSSKSASQRASDSSESSLLRLNAKARLLAGPCFSIYLHFIELSKTKMPHPTDLFL